MSEVDFPPEETDQVGITSDEQPEKKSLLASITVFETMLVLSFGFIVLATFLLFTVLRQYSEGFPFGGGMPYSTSEIQFLMW